MPKHTRRLINTKFNDITGRITRYYMYYVRTLGNPFSDKKSVSDLHVCCKNEGVVCQSVKLTGVVIRDCTKRRT